MHEEKRLPKKYFGRKFHGQQARKVYNGNRYGVECENTASYIKGGL